MLTSIALKTKPLSTSRAVSAIEPGRILYFFITLSFPFLFIVCIILYLFEFVKVYFQFSPTILARKSETARLILVSNKSLWKVPSDTSKYILAAFIFLARQFDISIPASLALLILPVE